MTTSTLPQGEFLPTTEAEWGALYAQLFNGIVNSFEKRGDSHQKQEHSHDDIRDAVSEAFLKIMGSSSHLHLKEPLRPKTAGGWHKFIHQQAEYILSHGRDAASRLVSFDELTDDEDDTPHTAGLDNAVRNRSCAEIDDIDFDRNLTPRDGHCCAYDRWLLRNQIFGKADWALKEHNVSETNRRLYFLITAYGCSGREALRMVYGPMSPAEEKKYLNRLARNKFTATAILRAEFANDPFFGEFLAAA